MAKWNENIKYNNIKIKMKLKFRALLPRQFWKQRDIDKLHDASDGQEKYNGCLL